MKSKQLLVGCVAFMTGAACADVTVGPGETLDWAVNPPPASERVVGAGGSIVYSGDGNLVISNNFSLAEETAFSVNGTTGTVRLARKILKTADAGRFVFDGSVNVGSDDSAIATFIPENSLAFSPDAPADADFLLIGFWACTVLPEKWSAPIPARWANATYVNLYGTDMFDVVDGTVTLPTATEGKQQISWRLTNPANVGGDGVRVVVPSNVTCVVRRMTFDAATVTGTSWGSTVQNWANDFQVDKGGTLQLRNSSSLKHTGTISGDGVIQVYDDVASVNLYGSLAGMATNSTLKLDARNWMTGKGDNTATRLNSSFPGKVTMGVCSATNIVSIGFAPPDLKYETNSVYRLGALNGGSANFYDGRADVGGSRIQYNKNQKIVIGTLTGKINVVASSAVNTCDLEIENLNSAHIYVKNGLRIRILTSGGYPEIHYSSTQLATTNAITVVDGSFINLIELPGSGKTVYLHTEGDAPCAVGAVTGTGTLVVDGGTVRIGRTEATARVEVRNGVKVTLGGGEDLSVLLGAKPALWLDAAATNGMVGAWNQGWANAAGGKSVLAAHPAVTFNGAPAATFTNGFPLIEKWFDHRPEQRLNYGWQDRCVNYTSTLYPLVYPYLVTDALNGRPIMSFGVHGATFAESAFGLGGSKDTEKDTCHQELRRMPLMQDMRSSTQPQGHGIQVQTAVMVFGSQNGGGRALLGAYSDSDSGTPAKTANGRANWIHGTYNPATSLHFGRTGSSDCYDVTNGIFSTKYETFVDNVSVDPTKTSPNGDWQVISVNGEGQFFRSLGMSTRFAFAGGQNYAELIVYTNKLTTTERRTVESYLAMKWNLPNAISVLGPVNVADGAFVQGQAFGVTGSGVWRIDSPDAAPTLDGTFAGTIEIPVSIQNGKVVGDVRLNGAAGSARGRIVLTSESRLKSGTYPLIAGAAAAAMPWTVTVVGEDYGSTYHVAATETGISLVVGSGGSVIVIR